MKTHSKLFLAILTAFAAAPALAHAHTGVGPHVHGLASGGFAAGFAHPLGGLDHLLAMVAVGLWAVQLGGRAKWLVPAAFVSVMSLGGALGVAGAPAPFVEQGISLSVFALGVLIAAAVRLPLAASMAAAALFALCHGYAHGAEMPGSAAGLAYGAGFVLATALLHASGICAAFTAQRFARGGAEWVRVAGAAICLTGVALWMQLV